MDDALIAHAEQFVREHLRDDVSGHDWWHVVRVRRLADRIARAEGADPYRADLLALLHDIDDYKWSGDPDAGWRSVDAWLRAQDAPQDLREFLVLSVRDFGYSKRQTLPTLEGRVVQDADRLDAIGAIGVARTFAAGAVLGRVPYDPTTGRSSLGHFDEKLLRLYDSLSTKTGREIGRHRHAYLQEFRTRFLAEWDGNA